MAPDNELAGADVAEPAALLRALDVHVAYGPIRAVQGVSVEVASGGVTTLIGPNGAGKSSLLKAIAGLVPARGGRVVFEGRDVTKMRATARVRELGLVLLPEGRGVFHAMTVDENLALGLRMGALRAQGKGSGGGFGLDEVFTMFPNLRERRNLRAQQLSGGEQQMLAVARAMLMEPRVLLVDEPSSGLAPVIVHRIFDALREAIGATGTAILLVEQDAELALKLANYAHVLENGRVVAHGPSKAIAEMPELRLAYLGGGQSDTGQRVAGGGS